jgi:hypothetical protein
VTTVLQADEIFHKNTTKSGNFRKSTQSVDSLVENDVDSTEYVTGVSELSTGLHKKEAPVFPNGKCICGLLLTALLRVVPIYINS